jgi:2-polyprenyl-3-methyl-5-hydroxy-6-metoxy-1,4-benzoquinol methylase
MEREDWDQRYVEKELVWSAGPNQFVAEVLDATPPGRALDLATGEGRNAIWLAERGWRVTAVDFSTAGLAKARTLAEARGVEVDWVAADVREYDAPGAFDLVLIAYLHLPAAQNAAVVRRAAAAVAPGGTFLLVGHDRTNIAEGIGGPQDPDVLHTPEDVVAALDGLDVQRAERVHRTVETDEHRAAAIDTLVVAVRPS